MLIEFILMVIGLIILTIGADRLVQGASALAIAVKISPLVVGLTVVAYGTGAPELAISLEALFRGQTDITVGNVIGSNLFNLLAILGASAIMTPLIVAGQLIRLDVPLLILVTGMFWFFASDQVLMFYESSIFVALLLAYTIWVVVQSRRETRRVQHEFEEEYGDDFQEAGGIWWHQVIWLVLGLVMLVFGAQLFLDHAVTVASRFGVSDLMIGLTLVAGGTSLPELATTVVAAYRGERDIAVGNAVGSSMFNVMGVLGVSGIVAKGGLPVTPQAIDFDIPVLFAVSVACLPIFFIRPKISRWQGFVFLGYYLAYTIYLILDATGSKAELTYSVMMRYFFIPLTGMAILIGLYRKLLDFMKIPDENQTDAN